MSERPETNPDNRFSSLDRSVFDGMASELLDKNGKSGEITRISKITSLEEALSELRKCGITDEDMVAYLDEWGKEMEKEFIKKPRS
jgi:hypothetical protein